MSTKDRLAEMLEMGGAEFISGNALAEKLGITRAAVWKNIRLLENDGYIIEAVTNKGYRLTEDNDVVSESAVRRFLGAQADWFEIEVFDNVTSTNTVLRDRAAGLKAGHVVIARSQSAGRGRTGRTFYSPGGSGLYLSMLLRPAVSASDAGRVTTAAAIAACRAIERNTSARPQIKWVNDVFVNGLKVCGILTEAAVNFETGDPDWVITGIGFDVYEPEGGYPPELAGIAGHIALQRESWLRARLAADFIKEFSQICRDLYCPDLINEYRERCFVIGEKIYVLKGDSRIPAEAVGISGDCGLIVRYEDGTEAVLSSGEVSVRTA